jgi:VCBS repeat-containing protein
MKFKIPVLILSLFLIYVINFKSDTKTPLSSEPDVNRTSQEALTEKAPEDALRNVGVNISPLEVEGFALTPVISIPSPTYSTLSPELQGQLTVTEDISPKYRTGGFRNERANPGELSKYLKDKGDDSFQTSANKSLVSSFDAGGQAANVANSGFLNVPADPHGAAGPNHLVNVFNTSIEFYNKDGSGGVSGSLQGFFAPLSPVNLTFDPKVLYDQFEDRWVVVTLQRTDTANGDPSNTSNVFIAVSQTDDPNGAWLMTSIDTKVNIGGADRWFDYPGLAVDEEVIYLTGNMFSFGVGGGAGSRLWIIDKTDFYAGNAPVVLGPIDPYAGAGVNTTTQPAHVYGTTPAGFGTYLISYSRLSDGTNEYWQSVRLDNPLGAISFNQQFLIIGDIEPSSGGLPVAPQAGLSTDTNASLTVATNDPRALDAVWRDNKLYGTATIESQSELGETSASWISFDANGTSAISLDQFGIVDGEDIAPGTFTFFPSIAVNLDGGIALGYSASGPTLNPGSYYTFKSPTDADMRDSRVLRAGTDFYYRTFGGGNNRWGDYSAMVVDPNDECFWVYNKHAVARGIPTAGNDEDGMYLSAFGEVCNLQPNGTNDTAEVAQNGTVSVVNGAASSVLENDTDADADDELVAILLSSPADASAFNLNADGTFSYSHDGSNNPTDSFTYNACDDGTPAKCDPATVNLTITDIDNVPTITGDISGTVTEDAAATLVSTGDLDASGGDVGEDEFLAESLPGSFGTLAILTNGNWTFSADNSQLSIQSLADNASTTDVFTITNTDNVTTQNITITIEGNNDNPVAVNNSSTTNEDTLVSVAVLAGDSDVDQGDTLSVTSCSGASNGAVVLNGNNCEFTPSQDFNGQGLFTYAISDGNGGSDSASVTVTVTAVNDNPVAANDSAVTNEDTQVSVAVLAGDSDADPADTLSVTSCAGASNGAVVRNGNNCEFTPAQNFNGQGSFNYAISDGNGGTDSASVTVVIQPINDEPSMAVNPDVYVSLTDIANPAAQNLACQFDFGPDDEDASQAVAEMNVSIINDTNGVLTAIDVDNTGALSYTFSGNSGVAEVTVSLQDDGGDADGGDDTSPAYTFNVNVQDYVFRSDFESKICQ